MTEAIWNTLVPLGPFLGAHVGVALLYALTTWVRVARRGERPAAPHGWYYLPIAIAGAALGARVVTEILYRPEFWRAREANSFAVQSSQGLAVILSLVTYPLALRLIHHAARARWPKHFAAEPIEPFGRALGRVGLYALALASGLIVVVIALIIWGHANGPTLEGARQAGVGASVYVLGASAIAVFTLAVRDQVIS